MIYQMTNFFKKNNGWLIFFIFSTKDSTVESTIDWLFSSNKEINGYRGWVGFLFKWSESCQPLFFLQFLIKIKFNNFKSLSKTTILAISYFKAFT